MQERMSVLAFRSPKPAHPLSATYGQSGGVGAGYQPPYM